MRVYKAKNSGLGRQRRRQPSLTTFTDGFTQVENAKGNVDRKPTTTVSAFQEPTTRGTADNKTSADFTITKHFTHVIPFNSHAGQWARREFESKTLRCHTIGLITEIS